MTKPTRIPPDQDIRMTQLGRKVLRNEFKRLRRALHQEKNRGHRNQADVGKRAA